MSITKALAFISIFALQLFMVYPYISNSVEGVFTGIVDTLGISSDGQYDVDTSIEYTTYMEATYLRDEVRRYRDKLNYLLDMGYVNPSIAAEAREMLLDLTDDGIAEMDIFELKKIKERLEFYIEFSSDYVYGDDDHYISRDLDLLHYKVMDKLYDLNEYRYMAELVNAVDVINMLDRAEQLLNNILDIIDEDSFDDMDMNVIWDMYIEATQLIERAEHILEYQYGVDD
ncbi:MAG TPA: hypothetical protein EYH44_03185 [Thermoprotei archaeon]|nr:hypothetical protein [Thermoprotei archaeon]